MKVRKYRKKVKSNLVRLLLCLKNYKIKNSILIFSEARGGSTWLMELLYHLPGTILNWEPLHVNKGVVPKKMCLGWRPFLYKSAATKAHEKLFKSIITFRRFSQWTTRYVYWKEVLGTEYVITKFVRANLCLSWVVSVFPELRFKPIFLLRHPITVAISRLKTFDRLDISQICAPLNGETYYSIPDCINNERYIVHAPFMESLQTRLEVEVALWCLNNAEVVVHPERNRWITVYYEDLVLDPKENFEKLLKEIGLNVSKHILEKIEYRKPSRSNYHGGLKMDAQEQLAEFLNLLTEEELERIQTIFDYFDLKIYSAFSSTPLKLFY